MLNKILTTIVFGAILAGSALAMFEAAKFLHFIGKPAIKALAEDEFLN